MEPPPKRVALNDDSDPVNESTDLHDDDDDACSVLSNESAYALAQRAAHTAPHSDGDRSEQSLEDLPVLCEKIEAIVAAWESVVQQDRNSFEAFGLEPPGDSIQSALILVNLVNNRYYEGRSILQLYLSLLVRHTEVDVPLAVKCRIFQTFRVMDIYRDTCLHRIELIRFQHGIGDRFSVGFERLRHPLPAVTTMQLLIGGALDFIQRHNYSRYNGMIVERSTVGFNCWNVIRGMDREPIKMEQFVYYLVERETYLSEYITQNPSNADHLAKFLQNTYDFRFPVIKRNRFMRSFRNGVYFCNSDEFMSYEEASRHSNDIPARHYDLDFNYYSNYKTAFDDDFFDHSIDLTDTTQRLCWENIQTPVFEKLLTDQRIPDDAQRVLFALIGRMLYRNNKNHRRVPDSDPFDFCLDDWQVCLYLKGVGGTGKSKFIEIIQHLFEKEDFGIISTNMQRDFGLETFVTKFLLLGPDLDGHLNMDPTVFNNIVSGEFIGVNRKQKTVADACLEANFVGAGNEHLFAHNKQGSDKGGAHARRILIVHYGEIISKFNIDSTISEKLWAEFPNMLVKCNRAYFWLLRYVGSDGIWKHLPQYFNDTRNDLIAESSSFGQFLESSYVEFGDTDEYYISIKDLKTMYNRWHVSNNFDSVKSKWHLDTIKSHLAARSPHPHFRTDMVNLPNIHGERTHGVFVFGVRATEEYKRQFFDSPNWMGPNANPN